MSTTKMDKQTYEEAISLLIDAVNALHQAHSLLMDIGLDNIKTNYYGRTISTKNRHSIYIVEGLLRTAQTAGEIDEL